jgi:phosphoribosylaminoimidazole-succinocarboxamide synthase
MNNNTIWQVSIPETDGLKFFNRGKVRDVYETKDYLLIVTSDRISAFDVVLPDPIPYKGKVLTMLSAFWFDLIKDITSTHFISADFNEIASKIPALSRYKNVLDHRTMLVKKVKVFPVECVVRGYLAGSGWKEYSKRESVCGIRLPAGLKESDKLPEPIFTPSTKATTGHDENISFEKMMDLIGKNDAEELRTRSLKIYQSAHQYASGKGIIICDTKFEWGKTAEDEIILVDEVLTPDSSRFWPLDSYSPGKGQPSFDKQFVRDYLETTGWNKTPPAPRLPEEIIKKTSEKYLEAYKKLTGFGVLS